MAYVSQEDKKKLAPAIKAVLKKYNMKGSIAVRHHSTLVVNLKAGAIDFGEYSHGDGYIQVNPYWIDTHYAGVAKKKILRRTVAITGTALFCLVQHQMLKQSYLRQPQTEQCSGVRMMGTSINYQSERQY